MSTDVVAVSSENPTGSKSGCDAAMMPMKAVGKHELDKLKNAQSPAASVGHTSTESTAWPDEDTSPLRTPLGRDEEPEDFANEGGSPTMSPSADRAVRDNLKSKVPPAIAEEQNLDGEEVGPQDPNLPSRGSSLHASADCSPCVWHWKPQGCQRGQECGYCHLCPEGEIKNRKKAKLAGIRAKHAPAAGKEATEDVSGSGGGSPAAGLPASPTKEALETPGSALHGTGECRPCAWFHKPQGCLNGTQCRHCHMCPEDEIKLRKKNKTDMAKTSSSKNEAQRGQTEELPPPPGLLAAKTGRAPAESVGASLHGVGECRPCAWYHKAQGCQNGAECRHCHMCPEGEIKLRRKMRATATGTGGAEDEDEDEDCEDDSDSEDELELDPNEPAKVLLPVASRKRPQGAEGSPSPGSALHGIGECRPCAWFHKAKGCENGADCRHCHLCPEGEIRNRRKNKVTAMKQQHSDEKELDMEQALWMVQKQQEALLTASWQAQAQWELASASAAQAAVALAAFSSPLAAMDPVLSMAAAMSNAAAIAATAELMGAAASPMAASATTVYGGDESEMPSSGSALHTLGKCRPCAWFWKPQGCKNGESCAHCHLCPEGELKARKRVKEAAMRMGVLTPSGGSPAARTPAETVRTPKMIKLASCLGA